MKASEARKMSDDVNEVKNKSKFETEIAYIFEKIENATKTGQYFIFYNVYGYPDVVIDMLKDTLLTFGYTITIPDHDDDLDGCCSRYMNISWS